MARASTQIKIIDFGQENNLVSLLTLHFIYFFGCFFFFHSIITLSAQPKHQSSTFKVYYPLWSLVSYVYLFTQMKTVIVFLACFILFSISQSSAKQQRLRECLAKCEQHPDILLCEEFMCPGTYCQVCSEALRKCKMCCRKPSTTCVYAKNPFA